MENVRIEPYGKHDHQQVCDLIINVQRNEFGVPITLEQQPDLFSIERFYQNGKGNFWVAVANDTVVGTIALIDIGNDQIALRKMFVDGKFRGRPHFVGQKLMDTAVAWMREHRCSEVYLGTLDRFLAAIRFYERNGFQEITANQLPASFPKMKLDTRFFKKVISSQHPLEIVDYKKEHQPWFEKFNRDWIEKHFWMEPVDFQVLQNPEENILKQGGYIFMAALGEEIAGTVALKFVNNGVYEFTKMAVDERFRGKKIGKALANAAIVRAREKGAEKIILYSNTLLEPAISLYRTLGFREIPVDGTYQRSNIKMELIL